MNHIALTAITSKSMSKCNDHHIMRYDESYIQEKKQRKEAVNI